MAKSAEELVEAYENLPMRKYRIRRRSHVETFAVMAEQFQIVGEDTFVFIVSGHIKQTFHASEIAEVIEVEFKPVYNTPTALLEQKVIDSVNDGDITSAVEALNELEKLRKK